MSLWSRISEALAALASGEALNVIFDRLRGAPERSVGFTIAIIALGAKMAKADGEVTRDEVATFRTLFTIAREEEANAARVFNLARQDVAGFEAYARKIALMFLKEDEMICADDNNVLIDLLEGLFHIALSDGRFHPQEDAFLRRVATIFGLNERCYKLMHARFVEGAPRDPFEVLGIPPDASAEAARSAWRQAVKDNHPDAMIARGIPPEAIKLAERRLIAINAAWAEIQTLRAA